MIEGEAADSGSPSPDSAPAPFPIGAPPTAPGPLASVVHRPVWPTVIGIVALVVGAGGVAMSLLSAAAPMVALFGSNQLPAGARRWMMADAALEGVGVLVAGALIVGGTGLLRKRGWSGRLLLAWAAGKVLLALGKVAVTFLGMDAQLDAVDNSSSGMASFSWGVGLAFMFVGLLWALLLPAFVLIWFNRVSIKAEIANWR